MTAAGDTSEIADSARRRSLVGPAVLRHRLTIPVLAAAPPD